MRTVNFRDDVLWAIAYKMGLDPATNFQRNQAYAIATYINSWVRRLWDSADWPEWTHITAFTPVGHIVSWDAVPTLSLNEPTVLIGKVLKVYLVDPETTWAPVETPIRLNKNGIHCGFEHGPSVWIKFLPRCPQFTANEWLASTRYAKDALVYSPTSGECYKSKSSNNLGHDPSQSGFSGGGGGTPQELSVEETGGAPDNPGLSETTQIMDVFATTAGGGSIPDPPAAGASADIAVSDSSGAVLFTATFSATGAESLEDIFTDLASQLSAGLVGFTVTLTTSPLSIRLEDASDFSVSATATTGGLLSYHLTVVQAQKYVPAVPALSGHGQQLLLSITEDQVIPGGLYRATFTTVDSVEHDAVYTALPTDSAQQILSGLIDSTIALQGADPFFTGVSSALDTTSPSATFTVAQTLGTVSLHPVVIPPGTSFWEYVPFPFDLVDTVVQGTLADVRGEQGQTDKKAADENLVVPEMQLRLGAKQGKDYDALSDQQRGHSRYAVK